MLIAVVVGCCGCCGCCICLVVEVGLLAGHCTCFSFLLFLPLL